MADSVNAPASPAGPGTPSGDYNAMCAYWKLVADVMGGLPAVKQGGEAYLPRFEEESAEAYNRRLDSARLTNLFAKGVSDLTLRPFSEPMRLTDETNEQLAEIAKDVDQRGSTLQEFSECLFRAALADGYTWVLVDQAANVPANASIAQERQLGIRPFWRQYMAVDVIYVKSLFRGGKEILEEIRLREMEIERDGWDETEVEYIRVFKLTAGESGDSVTWERHRKQVTQGGQTEWILVEGPNALGIPRIPMVPIMFGKRMGQTWRVEPPLQDAAYLQVELYRQENAISHISELTAFPMLAANNMVPEVDAQGRPKKIVVGPNTVLWGSGGADGVAGSWAYVEPGGTSLRFLQEREKETRQMLMELIRQPLHTPAPNLTVVSAASASSSSSNAVKAWAGRLEDGIDGAMELTAEWMSLADAEFGAEIHKDFEVGLGEQDVQHLISMATGDYPLISREAFLAEMQRRGVLSGNYDAAADLLKLARDGMDDEPPSGAGEGDE